MLQTTQLRRKVSWYYITFLLYNVPQMSSWSQSHKSHPPVTCISLFVSETVYVYDTGCFKLIEDNRHESVEWGHSQVRITSLESDVLSPLSACTQCTVQFEYRHSNLCTAFGIAHMENILMVLHSVVLQCWMIKTEWEWRLYFNK